MNHLSVLQKLAIKQHAQVIELEEGRSRISQRLSIRVEPGTFKMKKAGISLPSSTVPPPFISVPPPTSCAIPFGFRPRNMSQKSPDDNPPPPGVNRLEGIRTLPTIILPQSSFTNMPLPPGVSAEDHRALSVSSIGKSPQSGWSSRCEQFLAKLSGGAAPSKSKDAIGRASGKCGDFIFNKRDGRERVNKHG